jgi:2-polyprenyl-3-methyl-5-hydroxy-6-metoxy-1,4-benzoquinol methylase
MPTDTSKPKVAALNSCPVCGHGDVRELMKAPDRFHGRPELYRLLKCQSCSVVWTHNPPTPGEMDRHYSADYNRQIAAAGEGSPDRWNDRKTTLLQYKTGGKLLDLGCSSGSFLSSLKGGSWELAGIEMSQESGQKARATSGADVFVGDLMDAPFEQGTFDVVTCFHVFEHVYEPHKVMEKVWGWLKPGGLFYTIVPNIDSAGARVFGSYWFALELPRHLFHFSPASIRHLARSTGFEEVSITTHREMFIEDSVRYIWEGMLKKVGFSPSPLAKVEKRSIPFRIGRKIVRTFVIRPLSSFGFIAGDGESIHIILKKGPLPNGQKGKAAKH